jgi:hypothetical protein
MGDVFEIEAETLATTIRKHNEEIELKYSRLVKEATSRPYDQFSFDVPRHSFSVSLSGDMPKALEIFKSHVLNCKFILFYPKIYGAPSIDGDAFKIVVLLVPIKPTHVIGPVKQVV